MREDRLLLVAGWLGLAAAAAWATSFLGLPLRLPEPAIRTLLFQNVPPGTPAVDVRAFSDAKGWVWHTREPRWHPERPANTAFVGLSSMGDYVGVGEGWPCAVTVNVLWYFDAKGRLLDVEIWKSYDGP
jgi:hypothetical protein